MEANPLLETYLRQLHLPAFIKYYHSFSKDAAQKNLDYPRYLLALVEQEIQNRDPLLKPHRNGRLQGSHHGSHRQGRLQRLQV